MSSEKQASWRRTGWPWLWLLLLSTASLIACSPREPALGREPTAAGVESTPGTEKEPTAAIEEPASTPTGTPAASAASQGQTAPKNTVLPTEKADTDPTESAAESGTELPIFVQMVQVVLPPGSSLDVPLADLASNVVFAYHPADRTLLLRPSIEISPQATVLIGQTTRIGPALASPAMGELFQIPLAEASPVTVNAVDGGTGALTLTYAGETVDLEPGASRTFKEKAGQAVKVTILTNTGRLASIEPFPYNPEAR